MKLTSVPVIPAQPNQASYGPESLALFTTFTRDSYSSAFGVQAPAWDPSRPPKFWFDSSVDVSSPSNVAVYKIVDGSSGVPGLRQLVISASEASSVNIPGAVTYPPFVVAPSATMRVGAGVNPQYLTMQADAAALMQQLGGSGLSDDGANTQYPAVYPPGELRRIWTFLVSGHAVNAGMLLAAMYVRGVGAPGQWDLSSGFPQWVASPDAPTGLDDSRPSRPLPVRDLQANEELKVGPLGLGGVMVIRTGWAAQEVQGFTAADRAALLQIQELVTKLAG